jgi:Flp pilus assembly protein TadD
MMGHIKVLVDIRRFGEAEAVARRVVELNPQAILGRRHLASTLNAQGRFDEAIAEFMKDADRGGFNHVPIGLGVAYARKGRRAEAERVIAERKKILGSGGSNNYGIAAIYACLGEKDFAFEWLERCYQEREMPILFIKRDLALESLHSDPRFADLVRRIGLKP